MKSTDKHTAIRLVKALHYSRSAPCIVTYAHGLFPLNPFFGDECLGVVIWISAQKHAISGVDSGLILSLSRMAVDPRVPANACTFLLARSMRLIDRKRWPYLITYADEWQGHTGTIYKAANWTYAGKTKPTPVWMLNGCTTSKRKAKGFTFSDAQMVERGAECIGKFSKHRFIHVVEEKQKK